MITDLNIAIHEITATHVHLFWGAISSLIIKGCGRWTWYIPFAAIVIGLEYMGWRLGQTNDLLVHLVSWVVGVLIGFYIYEYVEAITLRKRKERFDVQRKQSAQRHQGVPNGGNT